MGDALLVDVWEMLRGVDQALTAAVRLEAGLLTARSDRLCPMANIRAETDASKTKMNTFFLKEDSFHEKTTIIQEKHKGTIILLPPELPLGKPDGSCPGSPPAPLADHLAHFQVLITIAPNARVGGGSPNRATRRDGLYLSVFVNNIRLSLIVYPNGNSGLHSPEFTSLLFLLGLDHGQWPAVYSRLDGRIEFIEQRDEDGTNYGQKSFMAK